MIQCFLAEIKQIMHFAMSFDIPNVCFQWMCLAVPVHLDGCFIFVEAAKPYDYRASPCIQTGPLAHYLCMHAGVQAYVYVCVWIDVRVWLEKSKRRFRRFYFSSFSASNCIHLWKTAAKVNTYIEKLVWPSLIRNMSLFKRSINSENTQQIKRHKILFASFPEIGEWNKELLDLENAFLFHNSSTFELDTPSRTYQNHV